MRTGICLCALISLFMGTAGCESAQKKIKGSWRYADSVDRPDGSAGFLKKVPAPPSEGFIFQSDEKIPRWSLVFAEDGGCSIRTGYDEWQGQYQLDGKALKLTVQDKAGKKVSETLTIVSLSKEELVLRLTSYSADSKGEWLKVESDGRFRK